VLTWNVGVRAVGAMDATLISSFTPVIAFIVAFWEGQRFVPLEILGAGLILAAIILNNLLQRRALSIQRP
jgi:drug/metabolite transporter (DMT)-like permease